MRDIPGREGRFLRSRFFFAVGFLSPGPDCDGGTCELEDVFFGRESWASSSATRADKRSFSSANRISSASLSLSLMNGRIRKFMTPLSQNFILMATHFYRPCEQLYRFA